MAVLVVNETLSGFIKNTGVVYATVHNAAAGGAYQNQTVVELSNNFNDPNYAIYRAVGAFNLSTLPVGAKIQSAVISLYGWTKVVTTPFNIVVVSGTDITDPLVDADYGDLLTHTTSFGSLSTNDFEENVYNDITLNATGIAALVAGSVNYLAFRHSEDIAVTTPTLADYIQWLGYGYGHNSYITITYIDVPTEAGYIWIKGTEFHYVDYLGAERYVEGTAV